MDLSSIGAWDVGELEEIEASLTARVNTLADVELELQSISALPGWDGGAASSAREAFGMTQSQLNNDAVGIGAVKAVTTQTAAAVTHLKTQLVALLARAASNLVIVRVDGSVVDAPFAVLPTDASSSAIRERLKEELHSGAHALIMQAIDVDSDAAQVLSNVADGTLQSGGVTNLATGLDRGAQLGALTAPFPPQSASPQQIDAYWDALPKSQRAEMISTHPSMIGNLDGIPSAARSEANISQIPGDREQLRTLEAEIEEKLDGHTFDGVLSNDDAGLELVRNKLADLDAIEQTLRGHPDSLLTVYDMTNHERGLAAVSVGNPDTADHITVTTPGLDTTVHGSLESMVGEAKALNVEMRDQLDAAGSLDETVANVAWIGYEPPQLGGAGLLDVVPGLGDVASDDIAADAGATLASYYQGLDAASESADPHISAFGHSYGSLTTSEALQQGASEVVDDAVFYGSPGLNAAGPVSMGMPYEHVWAIAADGDAVTSLGELGPLSRFEPGPYNFNYQQLSADAGIGADGISRDGSSGHSEYTRSGENGVLRSAGYNLAVIGIGRPDLVMK